MNGEWISSKEPPQHGRQVLIYWAVRSRWDDEKVFIGEYNMRLGYWRPLGCNGNYNDQITHWMPLPEPPKC